MRVEASALSSSAGGTRPVDRFIAVAEAVEALYSRRSFSTRNVCAEVKSTYGVELDPKSTTRTLRRVPGVSYVGAMDFYIDGRRIRDQMWKVGR